MKIPLLLLLAVISGLGVENGPAQQNERVTPKPPYVAPVPLYGHWVITLKFPEKRKLESVSEQNPVSIDTVKTGDLKRVTLVFKDGTSKTYDHFQKYILTASAHGYEIFSHIDDNPPYPFYTDGFLFVEGVNSTTFKETVKLGAVDCFYYQSASSEVWIAAGSMQPVAAKSNGVMAYYQIQPAPIDSLTLAPDEAAILHRKIAVDNAFRAMR